MRTAVLFTASAHDSQARTLVRDEQEPKQWDLGLLGLVSDGTSSPSANTHGGDGRSCALQHRQANTACPEHPRPNPLSSQAHRRAGARKKVPKGVSDGLLRPAALTHTQGLCPAAMPSTTELQAPLPTQHPARIACLNQAGDQLAARRLHELIIMKLRISQFAIN